MSLLAVRYVRTLTPRTKDDWMCGARIALADLPPTRAARPLAPVAQTLARCAAHGYPKLHFYRCPLPLPRHEENAPCLAHIGTHRSPKQ